MNVSTSNTIRHDMRNCVNAILLNVEVLKDALGDGEMACFLSSIESESQKLVVLLRGSTPD